MEETKKDVMSRKRLEYWKKVVERDRAAWASEKDKMDWREALFGGTHKMLPTTAAEEKDRDKLKCYHVRNVVAENIESMVDSRIPMPKVTALNPIDEHLARVLEQLLRFYVKRNHMRVTNDMAERMGPIQGGLLYLAEWDDSIVTPDGPGDVKITLIHPKQIIPQAGIYTNVEDMDHIAVNVPMTVGQVLRQFGVDVSDQMEEHPEERSAGEESSSEEQLVTVCEVYYKNGSGGVGLIAWTGETLLCDRNDYQARRQLRCRACGAVAAYAYELDEDRKEELRIAGQLDERPRECIWCHGHEFEEVELDEETIMPNQGRKIPQENGAPLVLTEAVAYLDPEGKLQWSGGTKVPYYNPGMFPLVLQKNISKFGQLLGESDVDKMADAQNTVKRMDQKMLNKTVNAGSLVGLPLDTRIETDTEDQRVIRINDPAKANMIKVYELSGDISQAAQIEAQSYEQARQASGITDSMQGRRDPTATSAKAKEFSAAKSEGRMESRRVMKQEAWAKLYEIIAKLYLAYADESRRVRVETATGDVEYAEFDRMQFLKEDDDGSYYFEDGFIFEVDDATSIGESREAMWQEINSCFSAGTLGNPQDPGTLIMYWGLMEEQGYPGAKMIKAKIEEKMQQAAQEQAMQQQAMAMQGGGQMPMGGM